MRISKQDLTRAADTGVISADQADSLWAALTAERADRPKFDLVHVTYYFGALLIIGAMGWYMVDAWERLGGGGILLAALIYAGLFGAAGGVLWRKPGFRVPAGLLVTVSVSMTPLAVYGLQRWLGVWPGEDPGQYSDFFRWIRGGWFAMEVATLVIAGAVLWFVRFPFLTAPIALVLWYMSMDIAPLIYGRDLVTWDIRREISMYFGLAVLAVAYSLDRRTREDLSFWIYLSGLLAFWSGLTLTDSDSELAKFGYFLINIFLLGLSVFLHRRAFAVFGALGVFVYFSHLAHNVFDEEILFPVAVSIVGILVICAGVFFNRHSEALTEVLVARLPSRLRALRPIERTIS